MFATMHAQVVRKGIRSSGCPDHVANCLVIVCRTLSTTATNQTDD